MAGSPDQLHEYTKQVRMGEATGDKVDNGSAEGQRS